MKLFAQRKRGAFRHQKEEKYMKKKHTKCWAVCISKQWCCRYEIRTVLRIKTVWRYFVQCYVVQLLYKNAVKIIRMLNPLWFYIFKSYGMHDLQNHNIINHGKVVVEWRTFFQKPIHNARAPSIWIQWTWTGEQLFHYYTYLERAPK